MTASITAVPTNEETISIIEKAGIKKTDLEKCMAEPDIKALYAANRAEAQ
jgi:2-hydroxychromene-2-carboxylate isomerase